MSGSSRIPAVQNFEVSHALVGSRIFSQGKGHRKTRQLFPAKFQDSTRPVKRVRGSEYAPS